jgi:hypothetical protein
MRRSTFTATVPVAGVILLALALTGCTNGGDSVSTGDAIGTLQPEPARAPESDTGSSMGAEDGMSSEQFTNTDQFTSTEQFTTSELPADATVDSGRQVISSGFVTLTADDPIAASGAAVQIVESAGGRVDGRTEQAPSNGDKGRASLTLRIPTDKLTATLTELKELGDNASVQLSDVDVTTEVQDLDARISALSASVGRLIALMSTATDTDVLIDLETAVSDRQGQLESMESQRRLLTDQVAMSSVTLELVSPADAPVPVPRTFGDAVTAGLAGFGAFFTGLFFALGYALPWLVLLAILVAVLMAVRRRRRRASAGTTGHTETPTPA